MLFGKRGILLNDDYDTRFERKGLIYKPGVVNPYLPIDSDCVLYHAYWDGTAVDHSSYGNDGTLVGVHTSFVAQGLQIDAITTPPFPNTPEGVSIPFDASLGFTDNFTIEGWMYLISGSNPTLCSQGNFGASTGKTLVVADNYNGESDFRTHPFYADTTSGPNFQSLTHFPVGSFYHVVTTYDSTAHEMKLYVNAIAQNYDPTAPDAGDAPTQPVFNSVEGIAVGYAHNDIIYIFDHVVIGELRIWQKVLLQANVTSIFNATKTRYGL